MKSAYVVCVSVLLMVVFVISSVIGVCAQGVCLDDLFTSEDSCYRDAATDTALIVDHRNVGVGVDVGVIVETLHARSRTACVCARLHDKNAHQSHATDRPIASTKPVQRRHSIQLWNRCPSSVSRVQKQNQLRVPPTARAYVRSVISII